MILHIGRYVAERRPTACSIACGQFRTANFFVSELLALPILSLQKCTRSSFLDDGWHTIICFFLCEPSRCAVLPNGIFYLDILLTVHLSIIYSLFPTWYTVFFLSTYNICYHLSSTCFRPHRPIIRRSKLYMQPMVFSPSADVFVVRPLRKNLDLLMIGLLRPETCRGKRIADTVRRRKTVYQVGNKGK